METTNYEKLCKLLGIPPNSTPAEITSRYRKCALSFHPDKGGDPEKMKLLNTLMSEFKDSQDLYADETLSDEEEDMEEMDPEEGCSAAGSQQQDESFDPFGGPPRVSQRDYDSAYCRLIELKWSIARFIKEMDGKRKQCNSTFYYDLKARFNAVPWGVFDNVQL